MLDCIPVNDADCARLNGVGKGRRGKGQDDHCQRSALTQ
jgi:hypothetical protein